MEKTSPVVRVPRLEVQRLSVRVVDGPDVGTVATSVEDVLTVGTAPGNSLHLSDPTVSKYHLELRSQVDGVQVCDLASTNGTRVGSILIERAVVEPGTELRIGHTTLQVLDGPAQSVEVLEFDELAGLRGSAPVMRRLMAKVRRVALSDVPVLIVGESGTGKELVARALHERSERAAKPFVTVDCGALTPSLVASELFGHERGAFTGAERQHLGAFERAHGGTLFLDELGELPAELQPRLLGVLERRRFQRVGGRQEIEVDVRLVSATNRDLRGEVNSGRFRLDLYFRVAVVALLLPALRERPEDIPLLVEHFLRCAGHDGPTATVVSEQELARLAHYHFPGNVRELRNWVEATLAMGEVAVLGGEALGALAAPERPVTLQPPPPAPAPHPVPDAEVTPAAASSLLEVMRGLGASQRELLDLPYKEARTQILDSFEAVYLQHMMNRAKSNVSLAARIARMDRSYLIKLLQRHELK